MELLFVLLLASVLLVPVLLVVALLGYAYSSWRGSRGHRLIPLRPAGRAAGSKYP